jgi:hypothetical protein
MPTSTLTLGPLGPQHLPPCRRVKVAWLGEIVQVYRDAAMRTAALWALRAIDEDDPRALASALRHIRDAAERCGALGLRELAHETALAVESPMFDVCPTCGVQRLAPAAGVLAPAPLEVPIAGAPVGIPSADPAHFASVRRGLCQRIDAAIGGGREDVVRELTAQRDAFDQMNPTVRDAQEGTAR